MQVKLSTLIGQLIKETMDKRNSLGGEKRVSFIHSFFYQLSYQRRKFDLHKIRGVKTFLISDCFFYRSTVWRVGEWVIDSRCEWWWRAFGDISDDALGSGQQFGTAEGDGAHLEHEAEDDGTVVMETVAQTLPHFLQWVPVVTTTPLIMLLLMLKI